jgi:ectoine hydroxylase-related dioxygenase (phytanoyl-CoA dioxygenase family)
MMQSTIEFGNIMNNKAAVARQLVLLLFLLLTCSHGFGFGPPRQMQWQRQRQRHTTSCSFETTTYALSRRTGRMLGTGSQSRDRATATATVLNGARLPRSIINVDDAMASMGLTQVKNVKNKKIKDSTTDDVTSINNVNVSQSSSKAKPNHKAATAAAKPNDNDASSKANTGTRNSKKTTVTTSKLMSTKKTATSTSIRQAQAEASPQAQAQHDTIISSQTTSTTTSTTTISLQTQLDYAREGHASLRNLIPPDVIDEVYQDLKAYSTDKNYRPKGEDSAPFLQFYNTWRDLPSVQRLATSPLLCRAACTMLNLPISESSSSSSSSSPQLKLRFYQDSVFIKRKNKDGITPWHIDGRMMPFDTSNVITFWIPLHSIPSIDEGGTGLLFINKSHSDFSLPYWNGRGNSANNYDDDDGVDQEDDAGDGYYNAYEHLTTRYGIENVADDRIVDNNPGVIGHHMPLNVGDCTIHNGWTMHCANGNKKNMVSKNKKKKTKEQKQKHGGKSAAATSITASSAIFKTRYAIAISYVDSHAEVRGDVPGVGKNVNANHRKDNNTASDRDRSSSTRSLPFLGDAEDRASYAEWIGDVLPRTRFTHELIPDVWPVPSERTS